MNTELKQKQRDIFIKKLELMYPRVTVKASSRIVSVSNKNDWKLFDTDTQSVILDSSMYQKIQHHKEGTKQHIIFFQDAVENIYAYDVENQTYIKLSEIAKELGYHSLYLSNIQKGILTATSDDGLQVAIDMQLAPISIKASRIDVLSNGAVVCKNDGANPVIYKDKIKIAQAHCGEYISYHLLYPNYDVYLAQEMHYRYLYDKDFKLLYEHRTSHHKVFSVNQRLAVLRDEEEDTRETYSQKQGKFITYEKWFDGYIDTTALMTSTKLAYKGNLIWRVPYSNMQSIEFLGGVNELIELYNMKPLSKAALETGKIIPKQLLLGRK